MKTYSYEEVDADLGTVLDEIHRDDTRAVRVSRQDGSNFVMMSQTEYERRYQRLARHFLDKRKEANQILKGRDR